MKHLDPLLEMIRAKESRNDYDAIVWLVPRHRYPPQRVTTMTVGEVLDWQRSIDRFQNSEAVGAYQFMEDTLRGMVDMGVVSRSARFSKATQDKLAVHLLERRGLRSWLKGDITTQRFANNLAMEWASLPVVSRIRGAHRVVNPGETYYAGDNYNKAGVSPETVLHVLGLVLKKPPPPNPLSWFWRVWDWIIRTFTKYS